MPTNSELLLAGFAAWNRDDCAAWLALLDPDVELNTSGVFPDLSPVYRGRSRAEKFWHQMHDPWETLRVDVEKVEEGPDTATAEIRFRALGADSGARVDMRFCTAIRVRDGLATELLNRRTFEEACEAIGQSQTEALDERP